MRFACRVFKALAEESKAEVASMWGQWLSNLPEELVGPHHLEPFLPWVLAEEVSPVVQCVRCLSEQGHHKFLD